MEVISRVVLRMVSRLSSELSPFSWIHWIPTILLFRSSASFGKAVRQKFPDIKVGCFPLPGMLQHDLLTSFRARRLDDLEYVAQVVITIVSIRD